MTTSKTLFVGRTAEGERVWVTLELRARGARSDMRTVDHDLLYGPYTELAITGSAVLPRARTIDACGQIHEYLAQVVDYRDSAFTNVSGEMLLLLWKRWHLNGMRAACAHMAGLLPADTSYEARQHITCPETGYRYGSAWLVEPLPESVIAQVRGLMTLPAGDVPAYVGA